MMPLIKKYELAWFRLLTSWATLALLLAGVVALSAR